MVADWNLFNAIKYLHGLALIGTTDHRLLFRETTGDIFKSLSVKTWVYTARIVQYQAVAVK